MKRIALLLLFIIGVSGLAYLLVSRTDGGSDPVNLLPDATMAMVDWKNAVDSYERFSDSRLGRQIAAIDWPQVLHDLGYPQDQIARVTNRAHKLQNIIHSPLFRELFSRRIVLALLKDESGRDDSQSAGPAGHLVLIARPRHEASFLDLFSSLFAGDLKYTKEWYKGTVIKTMDIGNDVSMSTAVKNGLVLAAFSPETLKRCLSQALKRLTDKQSGFNVNAAYRDFRKRARNKDDLFVYLDISGLQRMLKGSAGSVVKDMPSGILKQIASVNVPFQSFALFRQPGRTVRKYTSIARFDPEHLNSLQTAMYKRKPVRNVMLAGLPADLIAYFWTNNFDARALWNSMKDELSRRDSELIDSIKYWLRKNTGYTLNETLAMLGRQLSLNIAEINTSGFFPVPRLTCRIQIVDSQGIRKILQKVLAGLQIRNDAVAGVPVYSVILAGGLMQPSYALVDDFLLFADSRQQIETILRPGRNMLLQDDQFRKVDVGLTQPNNFVFFSRNAELIDGLKELISWAGTIIAIRDEQAGAKSKILIDRVALPVLDGLKMYKVKGARGYSTGHELIIESAVLLEK